MLVTSMRLVRIGISENSAHRMSPVSPSPPIVALNISRFDSGEHSMSVPSLRARPNARTCRPNVPRT
ncbi:hypothetical protein AWB82_07091 [Caballeronia glebae]|uniref:Uncharacterized protein n=1 Tax=Caballeronia glebae TaxID=1777143 RepID=A0A158DQY2_9BURK|nr:hypothetical protein AWB82_07091 [Caballeronia glebae]